MRRAHSFSALVRSSIRQSLHKLVEALPATTIVAKTCSAPSAIPWESLSTPVPGGVLTICVILGPPRPYGPVVMQDRFSFPDHTARKP